MAVGRLAEPAEQGVPSEDASAPPVHLLSSPTLGEKRRDRGPHSGARGRLFEREEETVSVSELPKGLTFSKVT